MFGGLRLVRAWHAIRFAGRMRIVGKEWVLVASMAWLLVGCSQSHQEPLAAQAPDVGVELVRSTATLPQTERLAPELRAPELPSAAARSPRPSCAPRATTYVRLGLNLDPEALPGPTWDPAEPGATSNFSFSWVAYDRTGASGNLGVYFSKTRDNAWAYYWVLRSDRADGGTVLGSGELYFNDAGALTNMTATEPLAVPASDGGAAIVVDVDFGTSIERGGDGLDGITQYAAPFNVTRFFHDGREGRIGAYCIDDESPMSAGSGTVAYDVDRCASDPTRSVSIKTNLHAGADLVSVDWDASRPDDSSNFRALLAIVDARGTHADVDMYFRHIAPLLWEYRVLLRGEQLGDELASGSLHFSEAGALLRHDVDRALRFPNIDGTFGDTIALDFGAPRDQGGTGVDGTTAFVTATANATVTIVGNGPRIGQVCPTSPNLRGARILFPGESADDPPFYRWPIPGCAGVFTERVDVQMLLSRASAIVDTDWDPQSPARDADVVSASIFDSQAQPWELSLYVRRRNETDWDYHAVLARDGYTTQLGGSTLTFGEQGTLVAMEPPVPPFRLPLADGTAGPAIKLDLGTPVGSGPDPHYNVMVSDGAFQSWIQGVGFAADWCSAL